MRKGTGVLCTLLLLLAFEGRSEGPGKRTPDLSRELYEAVLAEALPFPQDGPCEEGAPKWVVAIRSVPAWNEPESLWVFSTSWDDEPNLEVLRLKKRSLSAQLLALPPSKRQGAASQKLLHMSRTRTDPKQCPQLEELRRDFEALRIPALPENFLSLDDDHFRFWIDTCWGEPIEYKLTRVEGAFWGEYEDGAQPLLGWFDRLTEIEANCPKSKPSNASSPRSHCAAFTSVLSPPSLWGASP